MHYPIAYKLDASASHWTFNADLYACAYALAPFTYLNASASHWMFNAVLYASAYALALSISSILTPVLRTGFEPHLIQRILEVLRTLKALTLKACMKGFDFEGIKGLDFEGIKGLDFEGMKGFDFEEIRL